MQLQFLGTGAGMPSKTRNVTSIALNLLNECGEIWLFDCGEATQHQILHTSIRPRKITKIFITHLHGDHIFGLPGFLSSRSFLGGEDILTIYGPKGVQQFIQMAIQISKTHLTYPIEFVEITEGVVFEDDQFVVIANKLAHVIDCYGYRIEQKPLPGTLLIEKAVSLGVPKGPLLRNLKNGIDVTLADGSIVFSKDVVTKKKEGFIITILGDTKYCNASIELSKNATIVVHEATFNHATEDLAANYGHATNVEAAKVAKLANAQYLILTHLSARFLASDIHALLEEAQEIFPKTFIAEDFATFELKNKEVIYHNENAYKFT